MAGILTASEHRLNDILCRAQKLACTGNRLSTYLQANPNMPPATHHIMISIDHSFLIGPYGGPGLLERARFDARLSLPAMLQW
jgi:hypothetical protein